MIFLEPLAKPFLGVHLLASVATLILLTLAVAYLVFRVVPPWELGKKLALWGSLAYILVWISGLLIYPVFRVKVRAAFLRLRSILVLLVF